MIENGMETKVVPELKPKIESAAEKLSKSSEDSIVIDGADNQSLVKANTDLGKKMLNENMVLFPFKSGEEEYLVCITEPRRSSR